MNPPSNRAAPLSVLVVATGAPTVCVASAAAWPDIDVQCIGTDELQRHLTTQRVDAAIIDGAATAACLDLMRDVRAAQPSLPILFVAHDVDDVAAAIFVGANDFVVVSASNEELVARLRLLASPAFRPQPRVRKIGCVWLDQERRTLTDGVSSVLLSPIELRVFEHLVLQAGRPVSKADLQRSIWRQHELDEHPTNIAVVYISYLRRKLARLGGIVRITTITNVGYALHWRTAATPAPHPHA